MRGSGVRIPSAAPAFTRAASEGCRAEADWRRRAQAAASYGSASQPNISLAKRREGCRAEAQLGRRRISHHLLRLGEPSLFGGLRVDSAFVIAATHLAARENAVLL